MPDLGGALGCLITVAVCATALVWALPIVTPYMALLGVLAIVARLVWFHTGC